MSSTPKLTYFNLPGRAEIPRLLFAAGNVIFEDVRVTGVSCVCGVAARSQCAGGCRRGRLRSPCACLAATCFIECLSSSLRALGCRRSSRA
jgi:hypothetical protein